MDIAIKYMQRCLQLAEKGLGNTAPNPMVGAILVYNKKIIGEGYTSKYGGNHAEVNCINSVSKINRKYISKSTLYVSLEPCSHFGKTPPCSNLIVENKIPKVVIGTLDTNLLVSGKGVKHLKENGIEVIVGVLQDECYLLNKRFFTFHNKKRPYFILKWAKSKDNFIGKLLKDKKETIWISNKYSQQLVHLWRSQEQAILVGTNTVLSDNPSLTTRNVFGKNPTRIVLDRKLKIPSYFKVLDSSVKTIILTEKESKNTDNNYFEKVNFDFLLDEIIRVLIKHEIQSVIVEGGKQTLEMFINSKKWDEVRLFIGDKLLNNGVKSPILNEEKLVKYREIENDILMYYERGK
jgi:diaminohydroxyphosphoribosylaminopyrimidine deaminase/5-amino-6-(5-phosphoribosylamino)uracil reductase